MSQDLLEYQLAAKMAELHGILELKTSNNIKINIQTSNNIKNINYTKNI